jgi:hypothetical protein
MPTVPRRPAAQERDRLQARRLRAAELFAVGVGEAEVARQLGVTSHSVNRWPAEADRYPAFRVDLPCSLLGP